MNLEEIKARCEAATPGPWECCYGYVYDTSGNTIVISYLTGDIGFDNAEFVAHAREDVPLLVAEVERLQAALEQAQAGSFRAARGVLPWQPGDELPEDTEKR